MRAAVCYEFGKPLVIEEVRLDPPETGEVRVRIAAIGICHSDIHLIRGEWGGSVPVIAGHEASGIVDEVGPGVTLVKPGDRVVVTLLRSCGRCRHCLTGSPYACATRFPIDDAGRFHTLDGQPIKHGLNTAAFAEYTVVDQSQLAVIPKFVPLDLASLLACGVITGAGAALNTAGVKFGESVVVIGAGGVGLNAIQGAQIAGADPIIAIDVLDSKLGTARDFGATHGLNPHSSDVTESVRSLTGGGADHVLVTVGTTSAVEMAFPLPRIEGNLVLVGMPPADASARFSPFETVSSGQRILGSIMGSTRLSIDIPRMANLYRQKRLRLDELVTLRYPFDEINAAIDSSEQGEAVRNLVVFDI
ncbi:MAG: Zn-dependent alcohol dehydrogenase [Sphaerobacteraceae bacterium]|nr:MAG: Zn-dependent alcohol dehydrogenase [Sphaerobacteraceae bacterium]